DLYCRIQTDILRFDNLRQTRVPSFRFRAQYVVFTLAQQKEIQMEEARDPPQPPAGDPQAHWQFSHAAAWGMAHYHAESKAQSLSAIMRQPCEYCGSKAKNSKEHAKKCSMLFQALAIQHLRTMNTSLTQGDDHKPVAPRKTEAAPKYKAFVSPLETAFNKGSHRDTKVKWSSPTQSTASSAAPKPAALPIRTIAGMQQAKEHAGTIKQFFQQRQDVGAEMRPSSTHDAPWYCRLKLQNAGAMCYLNAGLLALLHAINQTAQVPEELRFIQKLGNNAAERGIALSLSRMNGIRKLAPNWVFSTEQKDAAELLHEMFSRMRDLQVIWDTRAATVEGVRLRTQGTLPIPVPMPYTRDSVSLQEILTAWSCAGDEATALVASAELVCVQLGRYHPQGKSFGIVDMPEALQLPVFQDDSSIQWINYTITGAIIHLGRSPTTGHYRALLKVRHSWWLTDDNREAEGINLHDGHHRNVYLIFMRRSGSMEGDKETDAGFFDKYWPSVQAAQSGQAHQMEEDKSDDTNREDAARAAKSARFAETKGTPGKGSGSGRQGEWQGARSGFGKNRAKDSANWNSGSRGSWEDPDWNQWGNNLNDSEIKALRKEVKKLKEEMFALQKMTLRHEDFGNCIKSELSWVMFLRLDMKASIVPSLYTMQQKWREMKENTPELLTAPMRVDLVKAMFKEFAARLEALSQQAEQMEILSNLGWLKKDPMAWSYVRWDPENERLKADPDKEPVPHAQVAAIAAAIQLLTAADVVTRFHPSREITKQMGGKNLTMSLQTAIHGDAALQIRQHLQTLSGLSATQLLGMSVRQERPGRSALAELIQRQING
ncbi:unnamed protein product, partial [Symbiodinium microadriaticum]